MDKYAISSDASKIHYTETELKNAITLVFVHGWLGNASWWNKQQLYFKEKYNIVQVDLAGHGLSDKSRQNWTRKHYADDIESVVNQLNTSEVILVGHSMSGAYVLEASINLPKVKAILLVDTLKDLDQILTPEQAEEFMFSYYRSDFKFAVENVIPQYLFTQETPEQIKKQLQTEFLQNHYEFAINALRPLYETDFLEIAKKVQVPVRAINTDINPTNIENNRKYLSDYDVKIMNGFGHYPMLESPETFNEILDEILNELKV